MSGIKDSDEMWLKQRNEVFGACRYLEDPPSYRKEMTPMELSLFQTRACGYNHHPAIHSLYNASAISKAQGPDQYMACRLVNVLDNSSIVQFVHSFMSEIDTTIACLVLYPYSNAAEVNMTPSAL